MDEYIRKQAALKAMDTWDKFGCDPDGKLVRYSDDEHYVPYVHYEDMVNVIKNMPSADVQPVRHGRWERHYSRPGVYADLFWHCSVCGSKQSGYVDWFKYCPNCGARMDGEQDG